MASPPADRPRRLAARRRGSRPIVVAALLAGVVGGCSQFRDPRSELGELRVVDRKDGKARVELDVLVANPNAEAIGLRELRYELALGDSRYAGRRSVNATVGAGATSRFVLPAVVDDAALPAAGATAAWRLDGTLLYVTPGEIAEILLDAGVRRPKVRIGGRGDLGPSAGDASPGPANDAG